MHRRKTRKISASFEAKSSNLLSSSAVVDAPVAELPTEQHVLVPVKHADQTFRRKYHYKEIGGEKKATKLFKIPKKMASLQAAEALGCEEKISSCELKDLPALVESLIQPVQERTRISVC